MKKITIFLLLLLLSVAAMAQFPKPTTPTTTKRMVGSYWFMANIDTTTGGYADTVGIYVLSDTAYIWNNKGHLRLDTIIFADGTKIYTNDSSTLTIIKLQTDTIIGSNPSLDSCVEYLKVKHIASCSPLWLSSPDSVWVTGELRQIDGSVAFRGNAGLNPFHNDGTLFMWYGAKGALRAGYGNQNQWTTSNIGDYSVALGYNVIASGKYSFAANGGNIGTNNIASGDFSFVCGQNNLSSANSSFSGGTNCSATNGGTFVFGVASSAMAQNSYAIGNTVISNKNNQIVFGFQNDTTKNTLLSVGNGYAAVRSNALEVYADSVVRTTGKLVEYKPEHAFGYYADNTGYPVQISSANTWYDMTDSTAIRTTGVETVGFQNDNDTLIYDGYDDAHLYFTFTASVAGTNTQDFEMRVFNITDNTEIPGTDLFTTTGATNRTNVTILAYDKNANKGDRYIVQIRNLSAAANLQVYRYMAKISVEHYVH